jgi:hypothetical protein
MMIWRGRRFADFGKRWDMRWVLPEGLVFAQAVPERLETARLSGRIRTGAPGAGPRDPPADADAIRTSGRWIRPMAARSGTWARNCFRDGSLLTLLRRGNKVPAKEESGVSVVNQNLYCAYFVLRA